MTLQDLGNVGEILGALAVVISLFYVGSQIRQNKWRDGSLTLQLWVGWEALMINLMGSPGGKQFWAERAYVFGGEFRAHVENVIMKMTPAPEAKSFGVFKIG